MIIDFRTDPKNAARFSVIDESTGRCLDHLRIFFADDMVGFLRYYTTNFEGEPIFDSNRIPQTEYMERRIVIVPKMDAQGKLLLQATKPADE